MTNELTQDAEGSETIEKTAIEPTETSSATAEAAAPATTETLASEIVEPAAEAPATTDSVISAEPTLTASVEPVLEAATESIAAETVPEIATEPVVETPSAPVVETVAEPVPAETVPVIAVEPVVETPSAPVAETVDEPIPAPVIAPAISAPAANAVAEPADDTHAPTEVDFGAILEQFEQEQTVFHAGELVTGTVVGVTDRGVLIDFGYKSEGFVPVEEFTGSEGQMTAIVGETVEVVIRTIHSGDGAPQLSRHDALGRKVWDEIESAFQSETPVIGRVLDKTKGGLRIDLNGIEAFLPGSQIDSRPIRGLETYVGQDIEAQIIKFSRRRNNIVLSRKIITDKVVNVQKAETLKRIDIGYVVDGSIKNLTEYGAFVDIGGIDGLLHVTDMSWGRIHHPADQFKVGEHIQVKVLKLDREKEKVSLGFKQLLPDPWSTVVEVYPVNTKLKGTVSSVTEYGIFVELEPGVEGLVHVSEVSWSRRSQSPKRMFHKGQEVDVQVLGVDTVEKRISLGMKQFQDNPWESVDIKYPVGSKIIGRVRNLTDFGAFIELEEGIDGLVHVSDISWAKKIKHPKDVLKKDQEVEAVVTSIDKRGQRLSLSMKDLTPSAWEGFVATHRPGDIVKGKVSRFTNFGVFVELGEGLEGLCHISELSDERVENAQSVASLGQEMDFKILRIEPADQKIGLSHRAVGKVNEPVVDTKMYSTEAKGGMASLGELASLKFGGDAAVEAPAQEDPEERKRAKQAAKKVKAEEFAAKEAEATAAAEASETAGTVEAIADDLVVAVPESEAEPEEPAPVEADSAVAAEVAEIVESEETPVAESVETGAEAKVGQAPSLDAPVDTTTETTIETAAFETVDTTTETTGKTEAAAAVETVVDSEPAPAVVAGVADAQSTEPEVAAESSVKVDAAASSKDEAEETVKKSA